ncbi:MAG: LL-diaminopimelate aminotransferase [Desulfovibrionaceae bacterium]|nr:LL-diaminopimelate aminotransferase [Desulfovibrionaceae bacterium]
MPLVNENYLKLPGSYLFSEIARRVAAFTARNPDAQIIRMGIGDVTRPLPQAVINALCEAAQEQTAPEGFKGYGPDHGYMFLRELIAEHDFAARGVKVDPDEIFISDGAKCDVGNFQEIFAKNNAVAITDPVYPVYVDSNVMAGRGGDLKANGEWSNFIYLPCTAANNFEPALPERRPDLIYLCYPNNPTGTTLTREQLARWVEYARENESIILFDAAYEIFISEPEVPHSIYEIPGADEVAVEFRSFSKTAGFTGLRCAYTVVPHKLTAKGPGGEDVPLNPLWARRMSTKYNGCPYVVQKAAAAVYSPEGRKQVMDNVAYYLNNAKIIRKTLQDAGHTLFGGVNAPYVWLKTPDNMPSWDFFDLMLTKYNIVGTPGAGFGPSGEGYFRLTAFGSLENTRAAMQRLLK